MQNELALPPHHISTTRNPAPDSRSGSGQRGDSRFQVRNRRASECVAAQAKDLRTLGDDTVSEAFAINSHGQVVGISFGGSNGPRAFIWQDDVLTNLNDLVHISPDTLLSAQDINDAGQITGRVRDHATGQTLAFVATPIPGE